MSISIVLSRCSLRTNDCNKNGFDIVIGNPPYVESRSPNFPEKLKEQLQENIKQLYTEKEAKAFPRGADLLIFFYELSFRLINNAGINSFITENAWLSTDYGKAFQEYLIDNMGIQGIIDSDYKYFETADINTVITFLRKEENNSVQFFHCHNDFSKFHCQTSGMNKSDENVEILSFQRDSALLKSYKWGFLSSTSSILIKQLQELNNRVDRAFQEKIEIGQGLNLTKDKILLRKDSKTEPFYISDNGPQYRWTRSSYFVSVENISATRRKPIMFLPRGLGTHFCCMNETNGFTSSYVEIYEKEKLTEIQKLSLWVFCNSSLLWLLREYTGRCNLGGGMLKAEATDLKSLPLCFNFDDIEEMKSIYKLAQNASNPTDIRQSLDSEIHKRIDNLVYSYFNLPLENNEFTQMLIDRFEWRTKKSKTK